MREAIGRYRITGMLGEGGMGIVYAAVDERLGRPIAVKMVRAACGDPNAAARLRREAQVAAGINHPAICQLYEIGEDEGELFLAMELLQGEPLAARLTRGPLPLAEGVSIALGMIDGIEALHRQGIIHRDLKPSNVFLTPHGVKLLDFGLACVFETTGVDTAPQLTMPGTVMGTPQYAAPEQLQGRAVDSRTDVFATGVILYEMLTGTPPFRGATPVEMFHAIVYEPPPVLVGGPAVSALDRVVHRALAKQPADRYQNVGDMARDLRGALMHADSGSAPRARTLTRLVVLPLRVLRPDPETDFLAFSLADAVTSSLSGLQSLVVRSPLAAAKYASGAPDLKAIATDVDVDLVLAGSIIRAGDQVRVATQLLEAPSGTVVWSHTAQASTADLFGLQDDLTRRIVESLSSPLSAREQILIARDVPATPQAYEHYLRANELARSTSQWGAARDLYLRCVQEDPHYAPGWARLGRMYRLLGKYSDRSADENFSRAEAAFKRALELNPDLSLGENLYAQLEVDFGRAQDAMVRLLGRARERTADPELYAGLVHACRYVGLLRASIAAFEQARRLDPATKASVAHTFFFDGAYEYVLTFDTEETPYVRNLALVMLGREAEALAALRAIDHRVPTRLVAFTSSLRAMLEGQPAESAAHVRRVADFRDPEGRYYLARQMARVGEHQEALAMLTRVIDDGFFCYPAMTRDPWLDGLRGDPAFAAAMRRAEDRHRDAVIAFLQAGGAQVLGAYHDGVSAVPHP